MDYLRGVLLLHLHHGFESAAYKMMTMMIVIEEIINFSRTFSRSGESIDLYAQYGEGRKRRATRVRAGASGRGGKRLRSDVRVAQK